MYSLLICQGESLKLPVKRGFHQVRRTEPPGQVNLLKTGASSTGRCNLAKTRFAGSLLSHFMERLVFAN
ncbi:MAG: hypothetical protein QOJ42_7141 [Acidobacteriaceae bacterium]|jgi:hypothetical protein|nr:hypothetical protein [Acidobacteriaceae bacterium]